MQSASCPTRSDSCVVLPVIEASAEGCGSASLCSWDISPSRSISFQTSFLSSDTPTMPSSLASCSAALSAEPDQMPFADTGLEAMMVLHYSHGSVVFPNCSRNVQLERKGSRAPNHSMSYDTTGLLVGQSRCHARPVGVRRESPGAVALHRRSPDAGRRIIQ